MLALPSAPGPRRRGEPDPAQAATFVRQAGVDLAAAVAGAQTPADKQARLGPYLQRVVDEDGVARFCLGRYWQTATAEQRAEYLRLFRMVLLRGVVNRLGDYQAGSVQGQRQHAGAQAGRHLRADGGGAGRQQAGQHHLDGGRGDGALRIADVVAEGMSLRMTQRSDYASFLAA